MKLILKNNAEIEINEMSNRQALQASMDTTVAQVITFHIIDASEDVTLDGILAQLKDGNTTGFTLNYGDSSRDFTGWEISDLMEDIRENKRMISIVATKAEAAV